MKLFSFLIAQAYLNCLTTVGFAQCVSCTAAPSIGILNSSGYGCYDGSFSVSISGTCNLYDVSLIGQSSFSGVQAVEVVVFDQQTSGCYISFKGRNILKAWSSSPLTIAGNAFYDFSTSNSAVFGNNLKILGFNVFGIFIGDLNGDGIIDLNDMLIEQNSRSAFTHTYDPSDLNGDSISESADFSLL